MKWCMAYSFYTTGMAFCTTVPSCRLSDSFTFVSVDGLTLVPVSNYMDIDAKMTEAMKNRTIASTSMNATSRWTVFWAHLFTLHGGLIPYASLSFCPSLRLWLAKNSWTIIHISRTTAPRVMKFGQNMEVGDPKVDLEGQGHRSKIRVIRSKNVILGHIWPSYT